MNKVEGHFMSWDEAGQALQTVLDDNTIKLFHDDCSYFAYSYGSDTTYDTGQVDVRLAQSVGLPPDDDIDRYVGFSCCFGIVLVDRH